VQLANKYAVGKNRYFLKMAYIDSVVDRFCSYGFKCDHGGDVRHMVKLHDSRTQATEDPNCQTRFNFPRTQFNEAVQAVAFMTESQVQLDRVRQQSFVDRAAAGKFKALYCEMLCHARNKTVSQSEEDRVMTALTGVNASSTSVEPFSCTFKCVITITSADPSRVIFDLCGCHGPHCKRFRKDMCIHPDLEKELFENANTGVKRQLNASHVDALSRALHKKIARAVGSYTQVSPSEPTTEGEAPVSHAAKPRIKGGKHIRDATVNDLPQEGIVLDFTKPSPARAEQLHYLPSCVTVSEHVEASSTSSGASSRSRSNSSSSSTPSASGASSRSRSNSSSSTSSSSTSTSSGASSRSRSNSSSSSTPSASGASSRSSSSSDGCTSIDTDAPTADALFDIVALGSGSLTGAVIQDSAASNKPDTAVVHDSDADIDPAVNIDVEEDDRSVGSDGSDRSVDSDGSDEHASVLAGLEDEDAAADHMCDGLEELLVNTTEVNMEEIKLQLCPPGEQLQSVTSAILGNFEQVMDADLAAFIVSIAKQYKDREVPRDVWTRMLGLPSVLTCFDWNLRIRLTGIVSSQRKALRNGNTAAAEFMIYLVQLLRQGHALVSLKAQCLTSGATVTIDIPDEIIDWKAGPHDFTATSTAQFEGMATRVQEVIDAGMQVIHLVALVQAPLQKAWSHLPGCCRVLVFDDTFNASRIDMSLGAIMGYDPVSGKHLPLALVPLMYEQGVANSKTNALVWVQTAWRRLGNHPPKTWQFDCDMASINSTTLHTIGRALEEVPRFLISDDGRAMVAACRNTLAEPELIGLARELVSLSNPTSNATFDSSVAALDSIMLASAQVLNQHIESGKPVVTVTATTMVSPALVAVPELAALADAVVGITLTNIVDCCCLLASVIGAADRSIAEVANAANYAAKLRLLRKQVWLQVTPTAQESLQLQLAATELGVLGKSLVAAVKVPPKSSVVEEICMSAHKALQVLHPTSPVTLWIDGLFGVIVRLCDFHLKKAMKQHVTGHFTGQPDARKRFTADLMSMIHARTEVSFQRQWKALDDSWRPTKPQLMEYLLSTWIKDGESRFMGLWEHYRRRYPHYLLNTTNAAEAFFSVLKYVISMGHREASLKVTMLRLLGNICASSSTTITKSYLMTIEAQRQHASDPDGTKRKGGAQVVDRRRKVFEMLQAVMAEPDVWVRTPLTGRQHNHCGLYEIKSATSSTWYFVNLLANTCTCPLGAQCCKHILTLRLYHAAKLGLPQLWRDFEHYTSYPIRLLPVSIRDFSGLDGIEEDRIVTSSFAREPVPVADNDRLLQLALGTRASGKNLDELRALTDETLEKHRAVGAVIRNCYKRRVEFGAAAATQHLQAVDVGLQALLDRFPCLTVSIKQPAMMRLAAANRSTAVHQAINNGANLHYAKTKKRVRLAADYRTPTDDADDVPGAAAAPFVANIHDVTFATAANGVNYLAFGAADDAISHLVQPRNLMGAALGSRGCVEDLAGSVTLHVDCAVMSMILLSAVRGLAAMAFISYAGQRAQRWVSVPISVTILSLIQRTLACSNPATWSNACTAQFVRCVRLLSR
jgi:hypothetical protein